MGINLEYSEGQTPIDEDEKQGLKLSTISNKQELDEFEQNNIEKAVQWTLRKKYRSDTILTENFIKELHKRMFGDIWYWAGEFRKSNKNIGVDKSQIQIQLRNLLDDIKYWIEYHTFDEEEIIIRFKHRIVSIHLFPNGNGRHSRLLADIMISNIFNRPVFTWGSKTNLNKEGGARSEYIKSLREADNGNYQPLIQFARS
jgi:Fic-DOC domain mobile mystery protein B